MARRGRRKLANRALWVVVATGLADYPHAPTPPGIETFGGPILHSSSYRNPALSPGNGCWLLALAPLAARIALDLSEAGVDVALAVRGPINVIPRELFWSADPSLGPHRSNVSRQRIADKINAPLLRFAIGSIEKLGLKHLPQYGGAAPIRSRRYLAQPLIDIGMLDAIYVTDGSSCGAISQALPATARRLLSSRPPNGFRR